MENKYEQALEQLNLEYKKLHSSKEYRLGKKILKFKYFLKKGKFIFLLDRIINLRKMKYAFKYDKSNNDKIFKNNELNQIGGDFSKQKIAVYTVNIGKYDNLIQPLIKEDNVDYYYVSDNKPKDLGVWNWINANDYLPSQELTNVKKARFIKTHPHLIFENYKYSIFIDGNIRCITGVSSFINKLNKTTKIAIHPHPYRDCIYKEIVSCKITKKGNYKVMTQQLKEYQNEGMPKNFGLFETNVFVREHNSDICKKIMEDWWNEIKNKSERDQLSFTYVLWKNNYTANDIGVICDSIHNNQCVQVIDHLEEYEKEGNIK